MFYADAVPNKIIIINLKLLSYLVKYRKINRKKSKYCNELVSQYCAALVDTYFKLVYSHVTERTFHSMRLWPVLKHYQKCKVAHYQSTGGKPGSPESHHALIASSPRR